MTNMGRHNTDPIPFLDRVTSTGPMKRIRNETVEMPAVPAEETKRRAWPVAVIAGMALAAAVGIPVGLSRASSEPSLPEPLPAFTAHHSGTPTPSPSPKASRTPKPKPVPTATVTKSKNVIRYKPGPTVYRTAPARPVPTVTITRTMRPEPRPTKTIRTEVCIGIEVETGETTGEIECPT